MTDVRAIFEDLAVSGPITASRIVEVASDPDHPLHGNFQWDDSIAAREYRLIQARKLIVSVRYQPEGGDRSIQALIHVPSTGGGEGEYVLASVIARQPERWQRARDQVLGYLDSAEDSLQDLDEILRVFGPPRPQTGRAAKAVRQARADVAAVAV